MVLTLLIQAQATPRESGLRDEKWYLPLGLLSIATYLKENGFPDVQVLDADHDSLEDILNKIAKDEPQIVGANFNVFNSSLLDQVVVAHEVGAFTVVGGQAATPIPDRILINPNIDAVCGYDGEATTLELAKRFANEDRSLVGVPNLSYRNTDGTLHLASKQDATLVNLRKLPILDRRINGFDFSRYLQSWNRLDIDPDRAATSAYTQKGCGKTCTFCARIDKSIRQRDPTQIHTEFKGLAKDGVNYVYVVDDTFAANPTFLRDLSVLVKRDPLHIRLWSFVDARDISIETVDSMSALGMEKVLVGIETGNEVLRRKNGKIYTNDFLLERLDLLGKAGIKLEDSYVLGLAGETEETLYETFLLSKRVAQVCQTEGTAFNIMTPLIGSPDWNRLMHVPEMAAKYSQGYNFDINELRNDYFRNFCQINSEVLSSAR